MKYWTRVARSAGCGVSGRRIIAAGTGGCGARRDVSSIEDDRNLGACAGRKRAHDTCGCRVVGFGFASGRRCIASGPEALGCLHSLPADTVTRRKLARGGSCIIIADRPVARSIRSGLPAIRFGTLRVLPATDVRRGRHRGPVVRAIAACYNSAPFVLRFARRQNHPTVLSNRHEDLQRQV